MANLAEIRSLLNDKGTKILRFTWCDAANVIRTKGSHVSQLESAVKQGVAFCTGSLVSCRLIRLSYARHKDLISRSNLIPRTKL